MDYVRSILCMVLRFEHSCNVQWFTLTSFIYFFDHMVVVIKNQNDVRISHQNHAFSMSKIFNYLSSIQWFGKLPNFSTSTFSHIYGDFLCWVYPISMNIHSLMMHKWQPHIFIVMVTIGHCHKSSNLKKLNLDTRYNDHWGFLWSQNLLALNCKPGYFWSCIVILGQYFVLMTVSWPESHYVMYGKVKPA